MVLVLVLLVVVGMLTLSGLLYYYFKLPRLPNYKVEAFMAQAMTGPLAHRGGKPENTLAAIAKSKQHGAVGVEVDLAVTQDGQAVLLHDTRIDRTSNSCGCVKDMTLHQLRKLDFGIKTGG